MFLKDPPSEKKNSQDDLPALAYFSKIFTLHVFLSNCLQKRVGPMWPNSWELGLKLNDENGLELLNVAPSWLQGKVMVYILWVMIRGFLSF
jgi:hypothetical protein